MNNPIEITQDLELALTTQEREDLEHCESVIRHGRQVFVEVGEALSMIRDARLYRADYPSFEAYCEERWDLSRPRAYELMAAAPVVRRLSAIADTPAPANEAQVRPLTRLEDEAEQDDVWKAAAERRGDGQPPTARQVEEEIEHRRALSEEGADDAARELLATHGPAKEKARPPSTREVMTSSESNEWYTPEEVIAAVREVLGEIDLDPASCEAADRTVRALSYYNAQDDGMTQPWPGRVFLNPPYGKDENAESNQAKWSARLLEQYRTGVTSEAILLVNSFTGNAWFEPLLDFPICFPRRIRFDSPDATKKQPTQSNALVYLGPNPERFAQVFDSKIGPVLGRLSKYMEVPDGTD